MLSIKLKIKNVMKKNYTWLLLFLAWGAMAQTDCQTKLDRAKKIMEDKSLFKDYNQIFQDILPCADSGNSLAQNYIGLMYLDGLGTTKDESKAFAYIERSAKNKNATAQYNLGNMYRQGQGCPIDMNKAVKWYEKAVAQKNSRAAYSLGYMYLKGFGVKQDYLKAVSWLEQSDYGMAKHWLGVCYYLGYGVPQNTNKALEYLYSNTTLNSVAFLKNIKSDKRDYVLSQVNKAVSELKQGDAKIDQEPIANSQELLGDNGQIDLNTKDILGEWTGRLIDYDWSGKIPLRVMPIEVTFSNNESGDLKTKIVFNGKTFEDIALFENNNVFIEGLHFSIPQLYVHDFQNSNLEYTILGMGLNKKSYNNTPYLLANVDSFISNWSEPGTPISLVLRPKDNTAVTAEDEKLMLSLVSQKDEFIKLYPVPFKEQLYIGFELANPAQVQVTISSVATAESLQVTADRFDAGLQSYTIDTGTLPNGYYVVRVQENDKIHIRTVIKQ